MRTEELIKAISADAAQAAMPTGRVWWIAVAAAAVVAFVVFELALGPRPDIAHAMGTARFLYKFVFTLALTATAFVVIRAASRPGGHAARLAPWLLLAPALIMLGVAVELMVVPWSRAPALLVGKNMYVCLTYIPVIGIGPLAVFLAALRHGAPTRPGMAGAVAGLLAGGLAATFYAAQCTDDSPLFVAAWYTIAILGLAVLGGVLGRFVARW
jgi:hypothetical protein